MTRSPRLLSAGLTAALVLSLVPHAAAAAPVTPTALRLRAGRPMTTGRVLVRYRDGVTTATRRSAAVAGGATAGPWPDSPGSSCSPPPTPRARSRR